MLRKPEEFHKQAKKLNIKEWRIHNCSICGYPCGYIIKGDDVYYDSGCDCTGCHGFRVSSWEEIAKFYNRNQPENNPKIKKDWLKEIDKFWGFK
jgi:hypothetical protein